MSSSAEALSHEEAIVQFCGVTGATEDRAKGLLEACDWNLELAINMHVDTDDGRANNKPSTSSGSSRPAGFIRPGPSTSSASNQQPEIIDINDTLMKDENDDEDEQADANQTTSRSNNRNRNDNPIRGRSFLSRSQAGSRRTNFNSSQEAHQQQEQQFNDPDNVRPPIPPVRQVLIRGNDYPGTDSPQRRYNTRGGNMSDVYDAFRDFQAEAQWQEMAAGAQEGESSVSEFLPSDIPSAYRRKTLQDLFRPPLEIIYRGSLESAREVGQQQNKWILVNVQNCREFACQLLNRDLWSNQTVKEILKEHFIFWQVHHDSFDGQRFNQFYNIKTYPHVSIIDPRTGEQLKSWPNLTSIDHNTFCDSIIEFLTEQSSPDGSSDASTMKKLRVKEEDNNVIQPTLYDQSEEAQLEAAIKASLQEQITENNSNSSRAFVDEDSYPDAMESDNDLTRTSDIQYQSNNSNSASANAINNDKYTTNNSSEPFFGIGNSIATSNNSNHSDEQQQQTSSKNVKTEETLLVDETSIKREKKEVDLDEYKKYLGVDKEKFSDLNIRFPDGTRDQFKFPSDSLMKALFVLLTSKGYGMDQYNYVTNFPRRLLHDLPSTDTFQDAKLIRETIIVERKTNI